MKFELPADLYTAASVRELDRIAIDERNIAAETLMERAGQAAFEVMCASWPGAKRITVICGPGNNGGDGYVLARLADEAGLAVSIMQIGDEASLQGEARTALEKCSSRNLRPGAMDSSLMAEADVIVDALLGTGLDRQLDAKWQALILDINNAKAGILALDIPSGLHADTGMPMPVAVRADATVTFIGMKQGLLTAQGPAHCGALSFADLQVPDDIYAQVAVSATGICLDSQTSFLPARRSDTHKGQCGHVLLIGGDYGYAGAVRMAAEAAMRVGAGLVSIATRAEHALHIPLARPELMTVAVSSAAQLNPHLNKASVIVIGPGLGQSAWASALLAKVLQCETPLLLDADALNLLALDPAYSDNWVLTPHPGEAARLLSCSTADIQADRFAAAIALQEKYGGVCVLKGSGSLIVDAHRSISICLAGNPGMASGGMGDVLSGVIAGLLAQGLELADAARVGVCLHSAAADNAARKGERGLLATDLMPELRKLCNPDMLIES